MKVLGVFDRAYLINMDEDVERMASARRRLSASNIPFTRFSALKMEGPVRERPNLQRGHFGCARSHLAIITAALGEGLENVLIFEDDVVLADDTQELMSEAAIQLNGLEWDIFYLGALIHNPGPQLSKNLWRANATNHAHAYAIHRKAMQKCIAWIQGALSRQNDFFDSFAIDGLRVYHRPLLAAQAPGKSYTNGCFIDRLQEYAHCYDMPDFVQRCSEIGTWTEAGVKWWRPQAAKAGVEHAAALELTSMQYDYHRVGYDRRKICFGAAGRVLEGVGACEQFWNIDLRAGAIRLDVFGLHDRTFSVTRQSDGVWRGAWDKFEKMPIELTPIGVPPGGRIT